MQVRASQAADVVEPAAVGLIKRCDLFSGHSVYITTVRTLCCRIGHQIYEFYRIFAAEWQEGPAASVLGTTIKTSEKCLKIKMLNGVRRRWSTSG